MLIQLSRCAIAGCVVVVLAARANAQSITALTPGENASKDEAAALAGGAEDPGAKAGQELPTLNPIRLNGQVQFRVDDPVKLAPVLSGATQYQRQWKNHWWLDLQITATLQAPPGAVDTEQLVALSKLNGAAVSLDVGLLLAYRKFKHWGGWVRAGGSANFQIAQLTNMETSSVARELYGYGQADITAAAVLGSVALAAIGKYQKVTSATPQAIKDAYDGHEGSLQFAAILPLQFTSTKEDQIFFLNVQWDPFSSSDSLSIGFSLDFRLDKSS